MKGRIALSWSGGKDSALALHELRRGGTPPSLLLTTFDEESGTVPHHGVAIELLAAQADAAGLPLATVALPPGSSNVTYEQRLREAFAAPPLDAVAAVAFGYLFLADLRRYREARMAEAGRSKFRLSLQSQYRADRRIEFAVPDLSNAGSSPAPHSCGASA